MSTPLAVFGPGILIASRTDITIPSPVNVGFVQEFSIDATGTIKELFGQNQWPLAVARGTIKGTGKFKSAVISGLAWSAMFYGNAETTSSQIAWNIGTTTTLSTASTAAVQIGSSLTFDADLGITYANTGLPFQRVSTGLEATGKYSVGSTTPGLYNFATGDTPLGAAGGTFVKIAYPNTTSVGANLTGPNRLIGEGRTFHL